MSKSFNRCINYHVAYMLVALYFVCSIVLLFPYQNRVFRIIGFGITSYLKYILLHVMSVVPTGYVLQIKIYILAVFYIYNLLCFYCILYLYFIYYITFRINSKYLSSQEYRTTISITIIQILHHPVLLYLYVVTFYVKTMLPYFITSLTQHTYIITSYIQ